MSIKNTKKNHTIDLGDISLEVIQKDIKNVHLSVYPPYGRVRISTPLRMNLDLIRVFTISKLSWIRKQQAKLLGQKRETARDYVSRESHFFLGKRYLLKVTEQDSVAKVILKHDSIELYVRPGATREHRQDIFEAWYRQQLKELIPKYIAKYEKKMSVKVMDFGIKKMKTRWGTCNTKEKRIWLNLELAKKPSECIEYIVVHEMVHLLERSHNKKFIAYMDKFFPKWKLYRTELNRSILGHVDWGY
jgi:predicted metal-dependent hydrolase